MSWIIIIGSDDNFYNITSGDISSELYGDWLWDENFKFCLIFTHFSRFSPFSGYIWWNNTLSSLENFSLNSILFFWFWCHTLIMEDFLKSHKKGIQYQRKPLFVSWSSTLITKNHDFYQLDIHYVLYGSFCFLYRFH